MKKMCSVVIPVYNKAEYLNETLNSLLRQTYPNWEAILVDDKSTDNSLAILEKFTNKHSRFKLFKQSDNRGAQNARNFGLSHAKGEFVIFLDADDYLYSSTLENRVNFMQNHKKLDFAVFAAEVYDQYGNFIRNFNFKNKQYNDLSLFLMGDPTWTILQPIWRYDILQKIGIWDEQIKVFQDQEYHTRALIKGLSYKKINTVDCRWNRTEKNSISKTAWCISNLESHLYLIDKVHRLLAEYDLDTKKYLESLSFRYLWLAKTQMHNLSHKKGFFQIWDIVKRKKILPYPKYLIVKGYYFVKGKEPLRKMYVKIFGKLIKDYT